MNYVVLIFYEKVRASASIDAKPVASSRAAGPKSSRPTAIDILKLPRPQTAGQQQTIPIETEVDQYLSDPNEGTGIVEFWQVV